MLTIQLIIVVIPLALLLTIAMARHANFLRFITNALAMSLGVLFIWAAMPFDVVSMYFRHALPVLWVLAMINGFRRIGTEVKAPPRWQVVLNYLISLLLIGVFGLFNLGVFAGYPEPAGSISLSSPLRGGHFVVGQGGSSPFLNGHATVSPQNHALDILQLDRWGTRSNLFGDRSRLEDYVIFGTEIIAPCQGEVLAAVDGFDDLPPPQRDVENLAGNHVVLSCFDAEVVLAHMQKGSVAVKTGARVAVGDLLGRVGNSGNTSEPHLHIHAEKGGEPGVILDGEAVGMTVDGRYLVRGDTFRQD